MPKQLSAASPKVTLSFDAPLAVNLNDQFSIQINEAGAANLYSTVFVVTYPKNLEVQTESDKSQTRWQPRPSDPHVEAEMLGRLLQKLSAKPPRAITPEAAVAAASVPEPVARARMLDNRPTPTIEVNDTFDRAWRRVGLALDRVGFTVEDRDRSKGIYFVRYVDPELDQKKDDGFMSKLAFWKSSKPDPQTRYRIFVKDGGPLTTVQVLAIEGGVDQSDTSKKILNLLYDQLK